MPFVSYPALLRPCLLVAGFSSSLRDDRNTDQPDAGPALSRGGQSVLGGRPIQGTTILSTAQLVLFWSFWETDINEGRDPFIVPNQQTDGYPWSDESGAPLADESGHPLLITRNWLVRFRQDLPPPDETPAGRDWQLAFSWVDLTP